MSGRLVATILIFALAVLVYIQTVSGSFVYDDVTEILTNPRVHRIENENAPGDCAVLFGGCGCRPERSR